MLQSHSVVEDLALASSGAIPEGPVGRKLDQWDSGFDNTPDSASIVQAGQLLLARNWK